MKVYSWGNGANYQLGTWTTQIHKIPCRIDALQSLDVISVAATKFHNVAITTSGAIYIWGFGCGGCFGHPDFDIHKLIISFESEWRRFQVEVTTRHVIE